MQTEKIMVFETQLDHLTCEELGQALARLNAMSEVLDAILLNGIGKKNRPIFFLQVLCHERDAIAVRDAIFLHTHALGLRFHIQERYLLPRESATSCVEGHELKAKAHTIGQNTYVRPEADELAGLSQALGIGMPGLRFPRAPEHETFNPSTPASSEYGQQQGITGGNKRQER